MEEKEKEVDERWSGMISDDVLFVLYSDGTSEVVSYAEKKGDQEDHEKI